VGLFLELDFSSQAAVVAARPKAAISVKVAVRRVSIESSIRGLESYPATITTGHGLATGFEADPTGRYLPFDKTAAPVLRPLPPR
jgi:hypothetical protein